MSPLEFGDPRPLLPDPGHPGGVRAAPLHHGLPLLQAPRPAGACPLPLPERLPRVTVQLPLYNEMYVVDRLLDSVCRIHYPRSCWRSRSSTTPPTRPRRSRRPRWSATARRASTSTTSTAPTAGLQGGRARRGAEGRPRASSSSSSTPTSWPRPDILEKTLGHFADPEGGDGAGALGPHQPRLLAAHPGAVDPARRPLHPRARRAQPRRAASSTSTAPRASGGARRSSTRGGWQHDTLTEDLDLSYRAQMKGWRFVFLQDVVSPAEIPVEMNAFKSQQHRWAKGSDPDLQEAAAARSWPPTLPLPIKVEAAFHLTANFAYPLMILLSLLMFPAMVIRYNMGWYEMMIVDVPLFMGATMSVCSFYLMSQREVFGDTWRTPHQVPARGAVGGHRPLREQRQGGAGGAVRPSSRSSRARRSTRWRAAGDEWKQKRYRGTLNFVPFVELVLGAVLHLHGATTRPPTGSSGPCPSSCSSSSGSCTRPACRSSRTSASSDLVREQEA